MEEHRRGGRGFFAHGGFLVLFATIPPTLAQWHNESAWYYVSLWVLIVPATAVGGWVCARQQPVA